MERKINLAIVTGGSATELEVSLKSAQVVIDSVNKDKYEVYRVDITTLPWNATDLSGNLFTIDLNTFQLSETKTKLDFAFIAIHGTPAEDGKIQGYFDLLNVPYSACSVLASAITFDKDMTKQLVKDIDVKLAKSVLLNEDGYQLDEINENLKYPLFVKPNKNGSSYGVSKVKKMEELANAIRNAFKYDDEVLVEEFVEGRELANGVMEKEGEIICFPVTEIISENEFFDYEAKYQGKSKEITPANLTESQTKKCQNLSKQVYKKLKLSGAVRIDYFLQGDDFFLLEVNTIPGLSKESILPQQAQVHGFSLEHFFDIVISEALSKK